MFADLVSAVNALLNAERFEFSPNRVVLVDILWFACSLYTVPYHQVSNHTLALLGAWIMHPCREQGRFLCKEEAGACMSTKCLQLSLLFIHLFFIESWKPTHEPTNVRLLKQGRRNWLRWCRGTFKGELSDQLSSNYHRCKQSCSINAGVVWSSFHS